MPDTTPLPLPECPREDCPATINHVHNTENGDAYNCPRQLGRSCPTHDYGGAFATRCYAPRTQPAPAEDERIAAWAAIAAHPIFAPCYATAAPLVLSMLDRLDGLNAQPAPQPIDPADLKPGDEFVCTYRYRVDRLGDWDPSEKHGQAVEYHLLGHSDPDAALIADLRQYVTSATSDDELRDMIAAVRKADDARADQ